MYLQKNELEKLIFNSTSVVEEKRISTVSPYLREEMEIAQINNRQRICHFLAQILHESGEFQYSEEMASGSDYEWNNSLGNTQRGDGVRFKGRGFIQLTGRANYGAFSRATGVDYVRNPRLVAVLPVSVQVATWYWGTIDGNMLADSGDFHSITRAINGGFNGLADRYGYLNRLMTQWDVMNLG